MANMRTVRRVPVLSRDEHLDRFEDDFVPGQHFTALGPTGKGKTTLVGQSLQRIQRRYPDIRITSLHGKIQGRDPVVPKMAKNLNLRIVDTLPSRNRQYIDRKYLHKGGYILAPLDHPYAPDIENIKLRQEFQKAIHQNYGETKAKTITHINESHQAQEELRLKAQIEAPLQRGGPDNSVFSEAQRGRYLSYHTYGAPEHVVLFYDDDEDTRRRYSEFGVGDKHFIQDILSTLKTKRVADGRTISQALYMRRGDGSMYVIDT